jgi:hypothetical protein
MGLLIRIATSKLDEEHHNVVKLVQKPHLGDNDTRLVMNNTQHPDAIG